MAALLLHACLLLITSFSVFGIVQGQCNNECNFRLCTFKKGNIRRQGAQLRLGAPATSTTSQICRTFDDGTEFVKIRRTKEPLIDDSDSPAPPLALTKISEWTPAVPPFDTKYFKVYTLPFTGGLQSVGRLEPTGNQESLLEFGLCVVLPVWKYDVIPPGGAQTTITTSDPKDCVSFTVVNARLTVELFWSNQDDFDITVTKPDTTILSPIINFNLDSCDEDFAVPVGKETILVDDPDVASGTYTVKIVHVNSCDGVARANWRLRASLDGVQLLFEQGRTRRGGGATVGEFTFTIP